MRFNLWKGEEIIKDVSIKDVAIFTGYVESTIKKKIAHRTSDYINLKSYELEVITDGTNYNIDPNFSRKWDNIRNAAELIRSGKGKIVTVLVNGKPRKVTVPR